MTENEKPALSAENLTHSFKRQQALNCVSFQVPAGAIHGFVGPNGAGKTTTLKIASTLLKPQRGTMRIFGHDVSRSQKHVRRNVGFMPDYFGLYRQMTVFEYLDFFGAAYGFMAAERDRIIRDVLDLTDMAERQDDFIGNLSRGMQQRVSLARVLVHDPKLLLLDEPASGLDPRARIELMEILRELQKLGKTVFVSSHILSELGDLCDSVTILDHGEVRFSGPMNELLNLEQDNLTWYTLKLREPVGNMANLLREVEGVEEVEVAEDESRLRIHCRTYRNNAILTTAIEARGDVESFGIDRKHLNQAFMDLTTPGVGG